MVRFARTKGKEMEVQEPEDATPWEVLKNQKLESDSGEEETSNQEVKVVGEVVEWADFGPEGEVKEDVSVSTKQSSAEDQTPRKKKSKKGKLSQITSTEDWNIIENDKTKNASDNCRENVSFNKKDKFKKEKKKN